MQTIPSGLQSRWHVVICLSAYMLLVPLDASARIHQSAAARAQFERIEPCPSTGLNHGLCPGYVIDHVGSLCNDGANATSNMQRQTVADGKSKDRLKRKLCRRKCEETHFAVDSLNN